jgi:hypothetical protein
MYREKLLLLYFFIFIVLFSWMQFISVIYPKASEDTFVNHSKVLDENVMYNYGFLSTI